jgi:hypothetical protein
VADAELSDLPEYEEFGFRSSYPGPFKCRRGDMRLLVLGGDRERISSLVQRTLTKPAGGAVEYRALGDRVMLLYGRNLVSSLTPPWDGYGAVDELLASFWVPVWAGRKRNGRFEAKRLCMSVPHIVVDNPMSHVAGREIYGFAKALGHFQYSGEALCIEGYGGDFAPTAVAGWRKLIEIAPAAGSEAETGPWLDGIEELVDALGPQLIEGYSGERVELPGGVRLIGELCRNLRRGLAHLVFLKQFRDAQAHGYACYQSVVEAPARTIHVKPRPSLRDWDVTIHPLDSHPITKELGVKTQPARWCVELKELEFDVLEGEVVGGWVSGSQPPG